MGEPDPRDVYPLHQFTGDFARWVKDEHDLRYCFVIGAGASRPSGIPTGASLVDDWLKTRFEQERPAAPAGDIQRWAEETFRPWDGFSWPRRAAYYGRIYEWFFRDNATGQATLRRLMREKSPSFGYSVLANVLARTPHKVVLTTNFDNLVRDAIAMYVPSCDPFVCHGENDARFLAGHANRLRIVKIHGDIDRETYNAASQIETLHTEWDLALRGIFTDHTPIFLGYGGNDPGFMQFLATLKRGQFRGRPIWAYRVDVESLEAGHSAEPLPPGWPQGDMVRGFMETHRGLWLPTPGFDELMLILGHALGYENLARRVRGEADRRAIEYERTLAEAVKAMRQVPCDPWCPQLKHLASSAELGLLGPIPQRSWAEWRVALQAADSRDEAARLYQEALQERGESPELKVSYASFIAREEPYSPLVDTLISEARTLAEKASGGDSPMILAVKNGAADIQRSRGKSAEAQPVAEEVLRLRETVLGADHPDTLITANLLATILSDQQKFSESEALFRRALEARQRTLGPEHTETLWTVNNLANVLALQARHADATALHRRALESAERTLGAEHRTTLAFGNNLALSLYDTHDYAEAEQLLRPIVAASVRKLGPDHTDTLRRLFNLSLVLTEMGNVDEAKDLARRVRTGFEQKLGPNHPQTRAANSLLLRLDGGTAALDGAADGAPVDQSKK